MRPVPNFECYSVSENGEVYRTSYADGGNRGKYELPHKLTPGIDKYGYKKVVLSVGRKVTHKTVHRLVAETYIPNPNGLPQVNHIDGNKLNNDASNLEWVTAYENTRHAHSTGLHKGCCTKVILRKAGEVLSFGSIVEASEYFGHSRDCFRRNLFAGEAHIGEIDGWCFELVGGKNRKKGVVPNESHEKL